ncbi:nuclear transport factor 2 family protein, partial [bacterium]
MAGHQTVARKLEALERLLLEPEVRRDSDAVGALLADDFVEIAANGQVYDKAQIVAI